MVEAAAGALDGLDQGVLDRKVGEERAQIREPFVEGEHIGIGGLGEIGADSIDDGVGHLMRDEVLRKQVKTR